jgi:hypothetical protein
LLTWLKGSLEPVLLTWLKGSLEPVLLTWLKGSPESVLLTWLKGSLEPVLLTWLKGSLEPVLLTWLKGSPESVLLTWLFLHCLGSNKFVVFEKIFSFNFVMLLGFLIQTKNENFLKDHPMTSSSVCRDDSQ